MAKHIPKYYVALFRAQGAMAGTPMADANLDAGSLREAAAALINREGIAGPLELINAGGPTEHRRETWALYLAPGYQVRVSASA